MMKITYSLLIFLNIFQCFSQNNIDSLVYIEKIECNNCIKDTLIFYSDSTCRLNSYVWWAKINRYSTGTYTIEDSVITFNSFIKDKRILKVTESVASYPNRVYEWDYDSTLSYSGCEGYIVEFDKDGKYLDTLFFFPTKEFRLESTQMNSVGFVIYVFFEYVGEYIFSNIESNKIIIWYSDSRNFDKPYMYLKNEKFIIIDNYTIEDKVYNRIYIRQK